MKLKTLKSRIKKYNYDYSNETALSIRINGVDNNNSILINKKLENKFCIFLFVPGNQNDINMLNDILKYTKTPVKERDD